MFWCAYTNPQLRILTRITQNWMDFKIAGGDYGIISSIPTLLFNISPADYRNTRPMWISLWGVFVRAATGLPSRKSYSHVTHDVNLFRGNQYCPASSRWRCEVFGVGVLKDIWLFPLTEDFFLMLSKQQLSSSREEPPCKNRHSAEVKGQVPPCQPEERAASICKLESNQQLRFQLFILPRWFLLCFWLLLPS